MQQPGSVPHDPPVLVGFDGSRPAGAAFGWAQREAGRRRSPVRLVYVFEWSSPSRAVPVAAGWPDQTARRETEAAVVQAVEQALRRHPELPMHGEVADGQVVSHLRKLSERARLLVLGDRGLGGFPGLRAGSVATELAAYAHCPVVIVRGSAPAAHPVVVGLDDSPDSDAALAFAFEQAGAHDVDLVALRACQPPPVPHRPDTPLPGHDLPALQTEQRRVAERLLHGWPEKYPEVRVAVEVAPGRPADALIAASENAQLLVVGARGRSGPPGVPLGSTAGHLIQYAHCPVAVVRTGSAGHEQSRAD